MWRVAKSPGVHMSGFYKTKQQVPKTARVWASMSGLNQSSVNRKTAPDTELEIVVASCGLKPSTPELYVREQFTFATCGASPL